MAYPVSGCGPREGGLAVIRSTANAKPCHAHPMNPPRPPVAKPSELTAERLWEASDGDRTGPLRWIVRRSAPSGT